LRSTNRSRRQLTIAEGTPFEILKGCDHRVVRRIAKREGDWAIVKLVDDYRRQMQAYKGRYGNKSTVFELLQVQRGAKPHE
jgi:hypothetical protein